MWLLATHRRRIIVSGRRQQHIVVDDEAFVVGVFENTPAGTGTEPRCFLFSNAFRLPACRIVPVPYVTPYGPGTIVHAGFVPYVRRCTLHYLVLSLGTLLEYLLACSHPQEKSHQVSVGYRLQVPSAKDLTPLSSTHTHSFKTTTTTATISKQKQQQQQQQQQQQRLQALITCRITQHEGGSLTSSLRALDHSDLLHCKGFAHWRSPFFVI